MIKNYITVEMCKAELCGEYYEVTDSCGECFTVSKKNFEKRYLLIQDETKITLDDVNLFMGEPISRKIDSKTLLVSVESKTGFVQHETSSCVDPANFDIEIGKEIATKNLQKKFWGHLGFLLQWARL
jgi:hypothetical protein